MLEKDIEKALVRGVQAGGGLTYKLTCPQNVGVPDRLVVAGGKVYFVELKTTSGKLSKMQLYQIKRLMSAGADVRVLRGMDSVTEFIEEVFG